MVASRARSIWRRLPGAFKISALVILLFYVGSYAVLSRRAFQRADETNAEGFYFVEPTSDVACRVHELCSIVYFPLIVVEQWLGTGRPPASSPLQGLSLNRPAGIQPRSVRKRLLAATTILRAG